MFLFSSLRTWPDRDDSASMMPRVRDGAPVSFALALLPATIRSQCDRCRGWTSSAFEQDFELATFHKHKYDAGDE